MPGSSADTTARNPSNRPPSGQSNSGSANPRTMDASACTTAKSGSVGATTKTCPAKWHLRVTVTTKEPKDPKWPTEEIRINAGLTASAGAPTPRGSGPAAGAQSLALMMRNATSPPVDLHGTDGSRFHLTVEDLPTLWHLVAPKDEVLNLGDDRSAVLEIQRDRLVWLQLVWKDPEGKERVIPTNFPVTVNFDDGSKQNLKVTDEGKLSFSHPRARSWFTLSFPTASNYIASKVDVAPGAATEFLKAATDLDSFIKNNASVRDPPTATHDKFHFFLLPKDEWTIKQSDWAITADGGKWDAANFRFKVSATDDVATKAAPAKLKLDPHWQFVRFEFFDRYYGHSDHAHKRIGLLPLTLQGFNSKTAPGGTPAAPPRGATAAPDTQSNWEIKNTDQDNSCNCLPWILQKKADGSGDAQPRVGIVLQFVTPDGTFINSKDANTREIKANPGAAALKPSAERLRLYDLPALWKSPGWFARKPPATAGGGAGGGGTGGGGGAPPEANGKLIETLADADLKAPSHDKRLIFSLDDMVLTDASRHQLTLASTDRVAVFHNSFSDPAEAGGASKVGVYKHDSGSNASFFSKLDPVQNQYIVDYPNWSRIVVAQGNIFDAFAERVPDEVPNKTVGARAAVRWVDSPPIAAARTTLAISARPARIDKHFFSIQPFFDQRYNQTNLKYIGTGSTQQSIGRFDLATIRCCGRDGATELIANMHYFRLLYDFTAQTTGALAAAAGQKTYKENNAKNLIARFNGNDATNTTRTELLPQDTSKKIKGQVFYFVQPVDTGAMAHFKINIISGATARNWMQGLDGTGEFKDISSAPENEYGSGTNSYTAAHELGHGGSLPDEYNERWGADSFDEASVRANSPGDAYEDDAVTWDSYTGATTNSALMAGVVKPRNRYYWHSAEFARLVTGVPFKVKYGSYADYKVIAHSGAPNLSYIWWPLKDAVDTTQGVRGQFDVLLYTLGREYFTDVALANGPFDGIVVVVVKLWFVMRGTATAAVKQRLTSMRSEIKTTLNGKFYATGPAVNGAGPFTKVFVKFSPRFLVDDGTNTANVATTAARAGTHFKILVTDLTPPPTTPPTTPPPVPVDSATWNSSGNLELKINFSGPLAAANLRRLVRSRFLEMIGKDPPAPPVTPPPTTPPTPPPAPPPLTFNAADTKKLVLKVLTGGNVHTY